MYFSAKEILAQLDGTDMRICDLVIKNETEISEISREEIFSMLEERYQIMYNSAHDALEKEIRSLSGLTGGSAFKMRQISESGKSLTGSFLSGALYRALAVSELNAAMGRIVAAPTAGSCGILPAALLTMQEEKQIPERDCVMSLFTASAVGMVIANNASLAGAQGGCQAECGSAAAMAAAAIVELAGGTPKMAEHAIAIAIKNILGLVCDPVAGLVEIPCIKRNASGVAGAFVAAELALAGIESAIPADEVIWTMKKVGDAMSSTLKETAESGLAATPTGRRLHEHVFGTAREAHSGCSGCGGCSS